MTFLLLGLGVAVLIGVVESAIPWSLQPATKIALLLGFCGSGAAVLSSGWRAQSLVGLGSLGIAKLTYEAIIYLSAASDERKVHVMQFSERNPRRRTR